MFAAHFVEVITSEGKPTTRVTININQIAWHRIDHFTIKDDCLVGMADGTVYELLPGSYNSLCSEIRHLSFDPGEFDPDGDF